MSTGVVLFAVQNGAHRKVVSGIKRQQRCKKAFMQANLTIMKGNGYLYCTVNTVILLSHGLFSVTDSVTMSSNEQSHTPLQRSQRSTTRGEEEI